MKHQKKKSIQKYLCLRIQFQEYEPQESRWGTHVSHTLDVVSLAHTQTIQTSQNSVLKPPEAIATLVN